MWGEEDRSRRTSETRSSNIEDGLAVGVEWARS
jgi:hypothetical protein